MRKNLFALVLTISLLVPYAVLAQTVKVTPAERRIAETIKADRLSNWLHFVASDAMGGRDTPSQGLDITAEFLKMKLSRWGLKPAGDNGTFFQNMNIISDVIVPDENTLRVGETEYFLGNHFVRLNGQGTFNSPMVFAHHGWMHRAKNIDAYNGIDVRDKVVVLYDSGFPNQNLSRRPEGLSDADITGTRGTDWADPITYATQKGAKGIIMVGSPQVEERWAQIRGFAPRGSTYVDGLRETPASPVIPILLVNRSVGDAIFQGSAGNKDSSSAFAIDRQVTGTIKSGKLSRRTQNVVALWEGSDPVLKNEMVAVGAHYDHVGTNPNAPGDDKIYNGADDDGSGTVALLAMAEALAVSKTRPKRSILFVWHAGEEKGLWGAEYFNKFPTVNIKNVIAQLNIDMIGRSRPPGDADPRNAELSGPNEVYVIGSEMMSSTLGAVTRSTNSSFLNLDYNLKYDDPNDKNRFFFRS
nr:M20/M25/M40 family metallo-hydrolase [Blastocatellia bacterium]